LPPALSQRIEQEGQAAYPDGCCGVMIGRDQAGQRLVERLEPVANVWSESERRRRFEIDPRDLMRIDKAAGEAGQSVLGFYHSHPDHPARPSETDRDRGWPFYSYVIVSIAQGKAGPMTCWVLNEQSELFEKQLIENH
jgi:proteasome lid subunit RPN8/RPN11